MPVISLSADKLGNLVKENSILSFTYRKVKTTINNKKLYSCSNIIFLKKNEHENSQHNTQTKNTKVYTTEVSFPLKITRIFTVERVSATVERVQQRTHSNLDKNEP